MISSLLKGKCADARKASAAGVKNKVCIVGRGMPALFYWCCRSSVYYFTIPNIASFGYTNCLSRLILAQNFEDVSRKMFVNFVMPGYGLFFGRSWILVDVMICAGTNEYTTELVDSF
jgi:hypothetical protein